MYKITYVIEIGVYEAIVGAETEEEAITILREDCLKEKCTLLEVKDVLKLEGSGVLANKYLYERK